MLGKALEVKEGLDRVPFRGENGRGRGVARAVEIAIGGEGFDAAAEGEKSEVGFQAALEASERGVVGEEGAEGAAGAGEGATQGGGRGERGGGGGGGE